MVEEIEFADTKTNCSKADLHIKNVTQRYATSNGFVHALDDVSFTVEQGKFVGIVGPSGCGKSSLLLMMAGLLSPTEGRISLGSHEIRQPEPEEIGVVFQESSLLPWKTAVENVEFPLKLRGMPKEERKEKAVNMLKLVGLGEFLNRHPHELSGGMKQRVSIARGFCQDSRVLLMDEPFAALDEQTRMTLGDELLSIWQANQKTVVFVTHSLTEAVYLCDEVIIMGARPGRILKRLNVDLPRPRSYKTMAMERFGQLRNEIWELIRTGGKT
ncbi:MAG: ABC transporter ATP-binding protein [Pusillimonas sp.]